MTRPGRRTVWHSAAARAPPTTFKNRTIARAAVSCNAVFGGSVITVGKCMSPACCPLASGK